MTRTELIIQILKVVIGLAFGAYFVWWSLQVLDRLTPEYDGATAGRLADIIVSAKDSWSRMLPLPLGIRPAGQEQAQALVRAPALP